MPQQPIFTPPPIGKPLTFDPPPVGGQLKFDTTDPREQKTGTVADIVAGFFQQQPIHPIDMATAPYKVLSDPKAAVGGMLSNQQKPYDRAMAKFKAGDYAGGVIESLEYLIPIIGPQLSDTNARQASGEISIPRALAEHAGTSVQATLPSVLKANPAAGIRVTPRVNSLNPVQQEAVTFAQRAGIPVDAATATGNPVVRGAQHMADRTLGGGLFIAPQAKAAQEAALSRTGANLADRVHPTAVSAYRAGEGIQGAVEARVAQYGAEANKAYDQLRTIESKTPMPVDLRVAKAQLKPLYDRMTRQMPVTQQAADPALHAIKNILDSPDSLPASVVDMDLGAIKKLARAEGARDVNQGMASAAVSALEKQLQSAVTKAGPDAIKALQEGRAATVQKYGADALLKSLRDEPVQVFDQATWRGDAGVDRLKDIAKQAPGELPKVGRAYLDDLLAKATSEGGFSKERGIQNTWQQLGPQTKALLFPDVAVRTELDNFFRAAKQMAENPNPSGTGHVVGLTSQGLLLVTEPVTGATITLTGAALSKLFHSPAGVRALTNGLRLPVGGRTPAALAATAAISKAIGDAK